MYKVGKVVRGTEIKMKRRFNGRDLYSTYQLLVIIIMSLLAVSCMNQEVSSNRKRAQAASTESNKEKKPDSPNFEGEGNFLQNGNFQSSISINIPSDFENSLFLRGEQVDKYIKSTNQNNVQCLLIPYSRAGVQKLLVAAAYPRYFFNFNTNTQEYYYAFEPSATNNNSTFCQQLGVLTTANNKFPSLTLIYQLSDLCPNCSITTLLSDPLELYTQDGLAITDIVLQNLRVEVRSDITTSIPPNLTCTSSSDCTPKGYDCCSFGQCVNDKTLKTNVDQSTDAFIQALADIEENPEAILNYPQYFNLCGTNIIPDPSPTPRPDPSIEASERFLRVKALYDCTTPLEGEMSVCEVEYNDVQDQITNNGSNSFETTPDDRNFNSTYSGTSPLPTHSIYRVTYAGELLFNDGNILKGMTIGSGGNGSGNDDLDSSQIINVTQTPAESANNDTLRIQYKIDGSCEEVSQFFAKCYKEYVQGQNLSKVTDHFPASNSFLLPYYADITRTLTVTVDDAPSLRFSNWNLIQTTPARVDFVGSTLSVFDTQVIRISFFVNLQNYPNVFLKKKEARDKIREMCGCGTLDCFLKEVKDSSDSVIDYECGYPPPPLPPPPLQQTVLVSGKTVPHLYYDIDGIYQDDYFNAPKDQEGEEFFYKSNNLLRPNNVDQYIGFNEIYGSFNRSTGSAEPAVEVRVISGKTYDIYADSGSFSTCFLCGSDYYSSLARIFPQNFLSRGGGYTPDLKETNPFTTKDYRKDDLLFGRACFVPATMIPWTHVANTERNDQRRKRLEAQHFLFANGYQRDWYGFDYGSLIGSFDGVKWFSIGNERRIQARSNRLFLAINSYFGDLNDNTSFSVTVQDSSVLTNIGSPITNDFDSDGAECQKVHECQVDADCISKLGWEYTCQTITSMTTPWPRFDVNGLEVPGVSDVSNMRSLFGQTSGSTRRCVYRGRGAACLTNYASSNASSNYTGTNQSGLHACNNNYYCQSFVQGATLDKFNDRIARFGKSVKSQNASSLIDEDELDVLGLGTRIIGRPFSYQGDRPIPIDAQTNLSTNNISALCLPGRASNNDTFLNNHVTIPNSNDFGDQINGMGVTPSLAEGEAGIRTDYLSRCSILDSGNNYFFNQTSGNEQNKNLSDIEVTAQAGRQAIPTNALAIFESDDLTGNVIIKNFEDNFIDEFFYQESRCLRAPGATCFSDLDCAPNQKISTYVASLSVDDTFVTNILNPYEIKFWQEKLICSQEKSTDDPDFDLGENRCCRETGNNVTIGTSFTNADGSSNPNIDFQQLPGLSTPFSSRTRNTRLSTIWDLIATPNLSTPPLRSIRTNQTGASTFILNNQFNTFSEMASRTCCSKNWVRLFDKEENGGGHTWSPDKLQIFPKETFRCYNYAQCVDGSTCWDDSSTPEYGFTCENNGPTGSQPDDPNCRARQISLLEATPIIDWAASFDLTGIPQIAIKDENTANIRCTVNPDDQRIAGVRAPPNLFDNAAISEYTNAYSAVDKDNFNQDNIRTIFSSDQVQCCLPIGTDLSQETEPDPNQCCTGYIAQNGLCKLPDLADVTLYLNKYVSSEAQEEVGLNFNPETGFLNSSDVIRIACQKRICESGLLIPGVVLSNLKTRGHENNNKQKQRFIDGGDEANNKNGLADLFDLGLKWNTHIYCFSEDFTESDQLGSVISCQ